MLPCLQETAEGLILQIYVQPRSSKNKMVGLQGDMLKLKLTSPPVDGAANKCCCELLSKLFDIAKSRVILISGEKSRKKRILLQGVCLQDALHIIQSSTQ